MAKKTRQSRAEATTPKIKKTKQSKNNSKPIDPQISSQPKIPSSLVPYIDKKLVQNKFSSSSDVIALVPNAVFYANNFFTEAECKAWIRQAECNIGFEYVSHPATRFIAHRECGRIQSTNWEIARKLFERMEHFQMMDKIHPYIGIDGYHGKDYLPMACNGNIRLYKYEKGMSFGKHVDGSDRIPEIKNGNTEITVLIYLSSCTSGATRFYLPHSKKKKDKDGVPFLPRAGSILFHVHGDRCLEHEADPVLSGIKYVLRTDIVYGTKDQ